MAEEETRNRDAFTDMGTPELRVLMMGMGGNLGNADGRGVVIINAQGVVQMANDGCEDIFGYTKIELRGKNVSLLVPQPTASMHQGYLRAYITTGRTRMMGRTTYQLGQHKERHLVPVYATITRVSGLGEDTVIMGIIEEVLPEEGTATVWVSLEGGIMSCDRAATDWLAFTHQDLAGTPFVNLVARGAGLVHEALEGAKASVLLKEYNHHKMDAARMANAHVLTQNTSVALTQAMVTKSRRNSSMVSMEDSLPSAADTLLSGPSRAITKLFEMAQDDRQTEWSGGRVLLAHKFAVGGARLG